MKLTEANDAMPQQKKSNCAENCLTDQPPPSKTLTQMKSPHRGCVCEQCISVLRYSAQSSFLHPQGRVAEKKKYYRLL